ncbi:tRNA-uridine aminocarboxypropyltransferase [Citrus sinensis]|uniref:tRNA-uridine aminocarboxypropyltransferase n=1 Tax=Citrus sinensis TaxID=2711 RepID=A0ACB8N3H3_CITSI|nr:tRNA-uridine aminocarboxypropyltransferase [Citrus sinensis]
MVATTSTISRAFSFTCMFKLCRPLFALSTRTHMESPRVNSALRSPARETHIGDTDDGFITLQEWQGWGAVSPLPALVQQIVEDLKALEKNFDAPMSFGGNGGRLQGDFKILEDKKHRATYQTLGESEKKLQFFTARQIACRLLGSQGYLCQKCWIAMEDCMCSKVKHCSLWYGVRFWLYMHPKDFLRQNNTGKLLWQVLGVQAATLCLYGVAEDEEIMWSAFKRAGKSKVWCLYPNKNAIKMSVQDTLGYGSSEDLEYTPMMTDGDNTLNFVLIDGTWSNSAAMFNRLKEKAKTVWDEEGIPCISLTMGASAMHKLRPQPSWDRTCTAAAAIGLLSELQLLPKFSSCGLDEAVEAIEDALAVLLEALTTRRLRMGRSVTRKARHNLNLW